MKHRSVLLLSEGDKQMDLASRAEGRHSQTAAIRMIVPSQMLFCVPSIPLWCSARLRRLATPLEWAEVLTLLLVLLPGAPQECFLVCTLKIWLGATTDAWKWIINCVRTPQGWGRTRASAEFWFLDRLRFGHLRTTLQDLVSAGASFWGTFLFG